MESPVRGPPIIHLTSGRSMKQITYHFVFNRRNAVNKDGECGIEVYISLLSGLPFYLSTKIFIPPNCWDVKNKRVNHYHPAPTTLNARLQKIAGVLDQLNKESHQDLEKIIRRRIKNVIDNFNFNMFYMNRLNSDKTIQHLTVIDQNRTLEVLNYFNSNIAFSDIDTVFVRDFVNYLIECGYSNSTTRKHIKNLKKFINLARSERLLDYDFVNHPFRQLQSNHNNHIYHTTEECHILEHLVLKELHLDRVRDLYLIGCFTALRISDILNLRPSNIITKNRKKYIKLVTIKTGEMVTIPVHPVVKKILEKHNNKLPERLKETERIVYLQNYNEYIKEVGQLAGFNDKILQVTYRGTERTETEVEKWKLMSSHTGRRTGATLMLLSCIPAELIMKITGHKSSRSFMQYLCISGDEMAEKIADNYRFFNEWN